MLGSIPLLIVPFILYNLGLIGLFVTSRRLGKLLLK